MKKASIILISALCITPFAVRASSFFAGDDVNISQERAADDVYAAGGSVISRVLVQGDFAAAGGTVFMSGSTTGDALIAGGTINVTGTVGDDLRAVGGTINVTGTVGDDSVFAGGQVNILAGSSVGGDITVAGGRVVIDGIVSGDVRASSGQLVINGRVNGNVSAKAGEVSVGPNAIVLGTLSYAAPAEAQIAESAQVLGGVDFNMTKRGGAGAASGALLSWIIGMFVFLSIAGLIVQWILGSRAVRFVEFAKDSAISNLGIGFLALVAIPIAAIILMITIIGMPFGIFLLLSYILFIMLSFFLVPVFVGAIIWRRMKKLGAYEFNWKSAFLGAFAVAIVNAIPFIGSLAVFLAILVVMGTVARMTYRGFGRRGESSVVL